MKFWKKTKNLNLEELAWTGLEAQTETYKFLMRFRRFPNHLDTKKYPIRLNIFWHFTDKHESGMPSNQDSIDLESFENRLIDAVETDEFSILSIVYTGNGQREFFFHTSDQNEFLNRLTNMPQEETPYPIEINSNQDENWDYYYDDVQEHI